MKSKNQILKESNRLQILETKLRKMVREELIRENYAFLLSGPNDFYRLKSYFSAATPRDWHEVLLQDAKFMKLCQQMVSHLENMEK